MTTLLLVRHGETDWNAEGRLQGHTDRPLSDYGRGQARGLAEELEGEELEAIYASDLARARETAEIVGERLGLPVVLDPDLREKDWGTWEGLTAVERDRVEFVGESTEAHQERMLRALRRIAERHPGDGASSSSRTAARCAASRRPRWGWQCRSSRTAAAGSVRARTARFGH